MGIQKCKLIEKLKSHANKTVEGKRLTNISDG